MSYLPTYAEHYAPLGFKRVCSINADENGYWNYYDMDESLMYSDHRSWTYFLVMNGVIIKIGETGQPLGIMPTGDLTVLRMFGANNTIQPITGSKCRFGRYRNGDQTDARCRAELAPYMNNPNYTIEVWALACPYDERTFTLNTEFALRATVHKQMEHWLLDYYKAHTGEYPVLNKNRS